MTSEFMYYYVTFRATSPGVIGTIDLQTPVRRSTAHTVRIDNPLAYPLTYQTECRVPDINLPPQFTVPPNSEVRNTTKFCWAWYIICFLLL